jgi:Fic family protein
MKLLSFQTPEPLFSSRITDYVIELDFLRRKQQESTIEPDLLNQIRAIFRDIDAMASARIDGNKTGINKYLESKEDDDETKGRKVQEVEKVADTRNS